MIAVGYMFLVSVWYLLIYYNVEFNINVYKLFFNTHINTYIRHFILFFKNKGYLPPPLNNSEST